MVVERLFFLQKKHQKKKKREREREARGCCFFHVRVNFLPEPR